MKLSNTRPLRQLVPLFILLFTVLAVGISTADSPQKVDLEKAKAELLKAKQETTEEAEEKKTPRKRLFGRSKDKTESKPAKVAEEKKASSEPKSRKRLFKPAKLVEEKKEASEPKARKRLFKRDESAEKPEIKKPAVAEKPAKPESKPVKEEKQRLGIAQRISPFGKGDKEKANPEKKELAKKESKSEEAGERKRLLGGLFAKDDSAKKEEKPAPVVAKKKPEEKSSEKAGGKMFNLFGGKSDSKEFAKVDKTKLGKTVDSKPASNSGGAIAKKKSSDTGALGWYVVTEASAPFYAVGPGQPMPPEKQLDRGSMLTVTKGGWGWCNVKLGSGELGVVSAGAMRPATVAEVSRHTRPVATASRSTGSRKLFNILGRGAADLALPTSSGDGPIRNFGLLPPMDE